MTSINQPCGWSDQGGLLQDKPPPDVMQKGGLRGTASADVPTQLLLLTLYSIKCIQPAKDAVARLVLYPLASDETRSAWWGLEGPDGLDGWSASVSRTTEWVDRQAQLC